MRFRLTFGPTVFRCKRHSGVFALARRLDLVVSARSHFVSRRLGFSQKPVLPSRLESRECKTLSGAASGQMHLDAEILDSKSSLFELKSPVNSVASK